MVEVLVFVLYYEEQLVLVVVELVLEVGVLIKMYVFNVLYCLFDGKVDLFFVDVFEVLCLMIEF